MARLKDTWMSYKVTFWCERNKEAVYLLPLVLIWLLVLMHVSCSIWTKILLPTVFALSLPSQIFHLCHSKTIHYVRILICTALWEYRHIPHNLLFSATSLISYSLMFEAGIQKKKRLCQHFGWFHFTFTFSCPIYINPHSFISSEDCLFILSIRTVKKFTIHIYFEFSCI